MNSASMKERLERAIPKAPDYLAEVAVKTLEVAEKQQKDSGRTILYVRVLKAVIEILENIESEIDTGKVASASSDLEVLLALLEESIILEHLKSKDPLAGAKLRGLRKQLDLLEKEGGCVSSSEAAEILKMSKQGVHKARSEGRILGLPRGQNQYYFPVWQFPNGKLLPGLKEVYAAIDANDWMKASFMLAPNTRLNNQSPLDVLRSGAIGPVIEAASLYGEHGAV